MVTLEELKTYITHGVAVFLIVTMVTLIVISAFVKEINVPSILISLGSGAVGYYLRGINND